MSIEEERTKRDHEYIATDAKREVAKRLSQLKRYDTGTTDDTISVVSGSSLPGDKVDVVSDGTNWFAHAISKVAAAITFTTAS